MDVATRYRRDGKREDQTALQLAAARGPGESDGVLLLLDTRAEVDTAGSYFCDRESDRPLSTWRPSAAMRSCGLLDFGLRRPGQRGGHLW